MNLLVGRVTPCAPGFGIQANGAHGVTRPTPTSRFRGLMRDAPNRAPAIIIRLPTDYGLKYSVGVMPLFGFVSNE